MYFIQLTEKRNGVSGPVDVPVMINMDNSLHFMPEGNGSIIRMLDGHHIQVIEGFDQIKGKLNLA